jgi:hypothetical protein
MSQMGQTRLFGDVHSMSGLPPEGGAAVERTSMDVSFFQSLESEVMQACEAKERPTFFDNRDLYRR